MTQRLHLVFGGELSDPTHNVFKNVDELHIVGIYPDYQSAYIIAHLHRLRDEEKPASPTEELG